MFLAHSLITIAVETVRHPSNFGYLVIVFLYFAPFALLSASVLALVPVGLAKLLLPRPFGRFLFLPLGMAVIVVPIMVITTITRAWAVTSRENIFIFTVYVFDALAVSCVAAWSYRTRNRKSETNKASEATSGSASSAPPEPPQG